jgi:uncharacterized protein YndB with AHSA1/START domain
MSAQATTTTGKGLVARASVTINAGKAEVWRALTTPETIKKYMFGADTETDWQPGSPIKWKGQWEGKPFEDSGEIIANEPKRRLQYSHQSGADPSGNIHTVTYDLSGSGEESTTVTVTQDNNTDQNTLDTSTQNWQTMLNGLKKTVES